MSADLILTAIELTGVAVAVLGLIALFLVVFGEWSR